jgi:hypothetical protein
VNPGETVRVLTRFDTHSGVFAHHCHNLEHEDSGMMQNFEVLPPPTLDIHRNGTSVSLSWPESEPDWRLQVSAQPDGMDGQPFVGSPKVVDGRWTMTVRELTGRRFYRLVKP